MGINNSKCKQLWSLWAKIHNDQRRWIRQAWRTALFKSGVSSERLIFSFEDATKIMDKIFDKMRSDLVGDCDRWFKNNKLMPEAKIVNRLQVSATTRMKIEIDNALQNWIRPFELTDDISLQMMVYIAMFLDNRRLDFEPYVIGDKRHHEPHDEIFLLFYYQKKSYRELAKQYHYNEEGIKKILSRLREEFYKFMRPRGFLKPQVQKILQKLREDKNFPPEDDPTIPC